jgi:hypothetical protein
VRPSYLAAGPLGLLFAASLLAGPAGLPAFADVTERAGIRFVHTGGSTAEKDYILEVNGSGVALFDADGDGDLDIYFTNGAPLDPAPGSPPPRDALYRNDGAWRFSDVTRAAGLGDSHSSCGVAVADVDNDGDLDLFVANYGPDVLYLNRGDGSFDEARGSGVEDPGWGSSAAFADVNGDGLVDLYVANYLEFDRRKVKRRGEEPTSLYKGFPIFRGPVGLPPAPDSLFLNLGGAKFRDASAEWGIRAVPPAYGLGVLFVDVNRDGRPDVLVTNDTMANYLFLNEGGRRFIEAGLYLGLAYNDSGTAQASMGVTAGDARGLGREDIFITNVEDDTNTYYHAEENGFFTDATWPSGLGEPSYKHLGWGTFFFDADLDGSLDLFVANGQLMPQADHMRSSPGYRQTCQLFRGDGAGRFEDQSARAGPGFAVRRSFRGAAFGDLDLDGDQDIVLSAIDDRPLLLENRGPGPDGAPVSAWVAFRTRGTRSNRDGIGARVRVTAAGRAREHYVRSASGYASQSEMAARFGLGEARGIERVEVEWPSGLREEFPPPPLRTVNVLVEGSGRPAGTR